MDVTSDLLTRDAVRRGGHFVSVDGFFSLNSLKSAMTTSSLQLNRYYAGHPLYGGCYSKDQLKSKKPGGKFWILNMQNSGEGSGTHWVSVFDCLPTVCVYYDPYGIYPAPEIARFMKKSGKRCVYSMEQYQQLSSHNCGRFVIHFIDELLQRPEQWEDFDRGLTDHPSARNERVVGAIKL